MQHGGAGSAYVHNGCRCEECTTANTERQRRQKVERYAAEKDPNDTRHGKPSFYANHGCRCAICTAAWAAEMKRQYHARKMRRT